MLFDSHMHLNDEKLINNAEKIIERANQKNVVGFICVGYDKASSETAIELANAYDQVFAAIGIHPSEAENYTLDDLKWIEEHINDEKVVAVGEIGLDYYWDKTFADKQKELFVRQIEIANKNGKPIIVHMRDATEDTYELIKKTKNEKTKGVMHCYSGSAEFMNNFIDLNMYISLAGPVTFKNAKRAVEVAQAIDPKNLLVETDSPYLAPVPNRGKTNESMNVYYIAKKISEIKGMDFKELSEITFKNTLKLFNLEKFYLKGDE